VSHWKLWTRSSTACGSAAASTAAAIEEYRLDNEQYQREQSPLGATHARAQLRPRRENLSQERRAERATVRTEVYAAVVAKAIPAVGPRDPRWPAVMKLLGSALPQRRIARA